MTKRQQPLRPARERWPIIAKQGTGRPVSFQFAGDLGDASVGAGLIFVGARGAADPDRVDYLVAGLDRLRLPRLPASPQRGGPVRS
jgi:hypothetical protein